MPLPGLEPGRFNPESSALTIRPPCLPGHRTSQMQPNVKNNDDDDADDDDDH